MGKRGTPKLVRKALARGARDVVKRTGIKQRIRLRHTDSYEKLLAHSGATVDRGNIISPIPERLVGLSNPVVEPNFGKKPGQRHLMYSSRRMAAGSIPHESAHVLFSELYSKRHTVRKIEDVPIILAEAFARSYGLNELLRTGRQQDKREFDRRIEFARTCDSITKEHPEFMKKIAQSDPLDLNSQEPGIRTNVTGSLVYRIFSSIPRAKDRDAIIRELALRDFHSLQELVDFIDAEAARLSQKGGKK